jgi:hypothetical protein
MGLGQDVVLPSLAENAVIEGINAGLVAVLYIGFQWGIVDTLGLVMVIEAAVLMLVGGAMELGTSSGGRAFVAFVTRKKVELSEDEAKRATLRAATFTLVGVLLFSESLVLALIV